MDQRWEAPRHAPRIDCRSDQRAFEVASLTPEMARGGAVDFFSDLDPCFGGAAAELGFMNIGRGFLGLGFP